MRDVYGEFRIVRVKQFLTSKGWWIDYKGGYWEVLPPHEKRIIPRKEYL